MKSAVIQNLYRIQATFQSWWPKVWLPTHVTTQHNTATDTSKPGQGRTAPLSLLLQARLLAKQLQLPKLRQMTAGARTGENLSKRGRGIHFEETRMYQAGDDIRHIDWRVTARTGETHTKVFREEHERPVLFLVDLHAGMHFGTQGCYKSVLAAQIAAVLAFAATHDGNPVGGMVLHQALKRSPIRGKERGVLPLLTLLSQACEQAPETSIDFSVGLRNMRPMLKTGALLVIISDLFNICPQSETLLAQIAYKHPVWLLQTLDTVEVTPPKAGHYGISDGNHFSWVNTADPKHHDAYLRFCEARQAKIIDISKRMGMLHMPLYTHQPLQPQLIQLTRRLSQS